MSWEYQGRLSGEPAKAQTLAVGTRMYNHGDMANIDHFGTITEVITDKWGTRYQITPDEGSDRTEPYWIPAVMVSPVFKGNGLTRIVTEDAYREWRAREIAAMQAWATRTV